MEQQALLLTQQISKTNMAFIIPGNYSPKPNTSLICCDSYSHWNVTELTVAPNFSNRSFS